MSEENKVPIVIYSEYGRFKLSKEFREYVKYKGIHQICNNCNRDWCDYDDKEQLRYNKYLIEYLKTPKGKKTDPKLNIEYIPYEYFFFKCYKVDEYDGFETIKLKHTKLKLIKIRFIIKTDADNDEKINKIEHMFN